MRRKGRQHGMVLYLENHTGFVTPGTRRATEFDTVPTTNFMTKVSSKPTNHSRFTSKCWRGRPGCTCSHDRPVSKARTKVKEAHKHRRHDVAMNQLLVSHGLAGPGQGARWVRFDSQSASGLLNQLTSSGFYDHDEFENGRYEMSHDCSDGICMFDKEERDGAVALLASEIGDDGEPEMSFCLVDFVRDLAEDHDWCLVSEID